MINFKPYPAIAVFYSFAHFCAANQVLFETPSFSSNSYTWPTLSGRTPLLVGHGGEQFYFPEQTIPSFKLAAYEGADFVEPDIVLTKDGIPVCFRHLSLKSTTDVAKHPEFAHLKGTYNVLMYDTLEKIEDDWLLVNFTLSELKTLRVKQLPQGLRLQEFNGLFSIPTLAEFIETIHGTALQLNKTIGIMPELKYSTFHNQIFHQVDHFLERQVLDVLWRHGYPFRAGDTPHCVAVDNSFSSSTSQHPRTRESLKPIQCGTVMLQSFEKESLQFIHELVTKWDPGFVELVMLIDSNFSLLTPGGFKEMTQYADYIGIWKEYLYTGVESEIKFRGQTYDPALITSLGGFLEKQDIVPLAHSLGLRVILYTFPDSREDSFWGCATKCEPRDKRKELFFYLASGSDAFLVENIPEASYFKMQFEYEQVIHGNPVHHKLQSNY